MEINIIIAALKKKTITHTNDSNAKDQVALSLSLAFDFVAR